MSDRRGGNDMRTRRESQEKQQMEGKVNGKQRKEKEEREKEEKYNKERIGLQSLRFLYFKEKLQIYHQ